MVRRRSESSESVTHLQPSVASSSLACNLADRFRLTVYDAAYLELAQRRSLALATLDDELGMAAAALGLCLLGKN
jgi:predicted nucleic acid-binding protein